MQELEKILEEIDVKIVGSIGKKREGLLEAEEIIRKHIKNEDDILKFYYCESEDDYYLGQRVQNMYYARYEPGGFTWFMSRYLPWGEGDYPSEPKEIPFIEWIEGFIRKHTDVPANGGWIPVEERLPSGGMDVEVTVRRGYRIIGYYNEMYEEWYSTDESELIDVIAWKEPSEPYRERSEGE